MYALTAIKSVFLVRISIFPVHSPSLKSVHSVFMLEVRALEVLLLLIVFFNCRRSFVQQRNLYLLSVCALAYLVACVKCVLVRVCFNARHVFRLCKFGFTHSNTHNQITDDDN